MRIIKNWDVASYYPSLMIINGYTSRSIPSPQKFEEVYHKRIAAKKSGDTDTANALKLVLNTTYGATLNRYNDLYDPLMARSVCISGQLMDHTGAYNKRVNDKQRLAIRQLAEPFQSVFTEVDSGSDVKMLHGTSSFSSVYIMVVM